MSRPTRAGDSTSVVGLRLTQSERDALARLVASAGPGATASSVIRELIAGRGRGAPTSAGHYVDAPHGPKAPELRFRWTPRYVWTLHRPFGRPTEPPFAVRRRVLEDSVETTDDEGASIDWLTIEVARGKRCTVDKRRLNRHGSARSDGLPRHDDDHEYVAGCDVVIWVYDHCPTADERVEWARVRALEQAVLRRTPMEVWVLLPGQTAPIQCWCARAGLVSGEAGRRVLRVALPGARQPFLGEFYRDLLDLDLFDLAVKGHVEQGDVWSDRGDFHVWLRRPLPAEIRPVLEKRAHVRAERARRREQYNRDRHRWGWDGGAPPRVDIDTAFAHFGLDRTCSLEELKRAWWKRSLDEHPDRGGSNEDQRETNVQYAVAKQHLESLNGKDAAGARA